MKIDACTSLPEQPGRIDLFDEAIRERIEGIRASLRCKWCKHPDHPIYARGFCGTCYRWNAEVHKLTEQVRMLPPDRPGDPNFLLRNALNVAKQAVGACKREGVQIEAKLTQTERIDLEHLFDSLSRRILGQKKGSRLFHGHIFDFATFTALQRVWIWYLVSKPLIEGNRRDRRRLAARIERKSMLKVAEHASSGNEV